MSTLKGNQARTPKRSAGTCRDRSRPQGLRRDAWVRPFRRAHRAITSSAHLISLALLAAGASSRRARCRPVRASRELDQAAEQLVRASSRLMRAVRDLAEANACIAREPETVGELPVAEMLVQAAEHCVVMTQWLNESADQIFSRHQDVLEGLVTGALVPERPEGYRPRIILAPRPVPIRAFLLLRQPRVADRIAPLLRRRRRTPRPRALRVPRPGVMGRAPPVVSICLL
jgi:hypothetical protein